MTGLSPELAISSLAGVSMGASIRGAGLAFDADRWEASTRLGVALREPIDVERSTHPVVSQVAIEGTWYTPPFVADMLRMSFAGGGEMTHRVRPDLQLESYHAIRLESSIAAELGFHGESTLGTRFGLEHLELFAVEPVPGAPGFASARRTRPFAELALHLLLTPGEIRRDRRHALDVALRVLSGSGELPDTVRLSGAWRRTQLIGWHELRLGARGYHTAGDVPFLEEAPVGEHLRGPFSSEYFARSVASVSAELRWSLARDIVKVGLFDDLAVFGRLDAGRHPAGTGLVDAVGLGVYVLVIETLQLDATAALGFSSDGAIGKGLGLAIRQAY